MNVFSVPPLISSLLFIFFGFFVIYKNPRKEVNFAYFLLCLTTFWWQFSWFLLFNTKNEILGNILVKVGYSGIIFIPLTYYHFFASFVNSQKDRWAVYFSYFLGAVFLFFLWSGPYFISGHYQFNWGFYPKANFLHLLFLFLLFSLAGRSLFLLTGELTRGKRAAVRFNQVKYVLWALVVYCFASVDFLVNYGIEFYPPGFIFILISLGIIFYAIVTTRLLDIELVIKRSFVFAGIFTSIVITYFIALFISQSLFQQRLRLSQSMAAAVTILAMMVGYERLKGWLITLTDKFLFQKKYEYRQALRELSKGMAQLLPLKTYLYLLVKNIVEIVRIDGGAGVIYDEQTEKFEVLTARGEHLKNLKGAGFPKGWVVAKALATKKYLLKEEIMEPELKAEMEKYQCYFIIPSFFEDRLIGLLILGDKKSQDAYSNEDIDLFLTLAPQVAISIQNNKLYGKEREKRFVAEEKVEIAEKEVERASRLAALGTLAAGLAHEIRNPMTVLRSRAEDLKSEMDNKNYLTEYADLSIKHIDRILGIVNNMLKFARAKEQALVPLKINDVLNDTLTLVSGKIKNKAIQVIKKLEADLEITGDANSLQQAFLNIILNSLDFMSEDGILTLKSQNAEKGVEIEISDTGRGIEAEKIEHIFNPFFTTRAEGTGLGLAITYRIIQDHGGKISVESKVNQGTKFTIFLPGGN